MKVQRMSRFALFAVVLLLVVGAGPVGGAQPPASADASLAGEDTSPAGEDKAPTSHVPWVVETVDPTWGVGSHVSIAISPHSGTTYISYYDKGAGALKMAKSVNAGGNCGSTGRWECETVDNAGDVGQYSSIAIDPTVDLPGISYYDATNESLKYAKWLGSSWYIRTVDDPFGSVGTHTSLKFDASGVPHIAYHAAYRDLQSSRLFYATLYDGATSLCTNGDFQCVPIHTAYDGYTSLDINSHGHIGIAYQLNKRLMYARFKPSTNTGNCGLGMKAWTCTYIQYPTAPDPCATSYASLDHDDGPHGAHIASYCGYLHYARYVGTGGNCASPSWQCEEIVDMGTLEHTRDVSLAVSNAGHPNIAYHTYQQAGQFTLTGLHVARPAAALGLPSGNCGPGNSWYCERIPDSGHRGDYLAIAVTRGGLPTIAYLNEGFVGVLKVAYQPYYQIHMPLVVKNH